MAVTYRLKHVGINCENEAEAKKLVSLCAISSTWKPATKTIPIPLFPRLLK